MPATTKHELSDEERAERRRADREYARQAVEALRSSQGWQRWLAARRHFHAYSFGNQLLIAMARPTATRVAGFRAWLKLGYVVQRGERAIKVWAPCPASRKQLERWRQDGGDPHQRPADLLPPGAGVRQVISCSVRRCRRPPRRAKAKLPAAISLPFIRALGYVGGAGLSACAIVAELAPGGRRRSGDRARVSPVPPRTEA
ncbi:MAG: ArdC family protein [Solirubrobacteraceae bacterium]